MHPPSDAPAKVTSPTAAASMRLRARQLRAHDRVLAERSSTALVTFTGTATRASGTASASKRADREQQLLGLEDSTGVVDDGGELAVGIDHEAEIAARRAAPARRPAPRSCRRNRTSTPSVLANGFTASTSARSLVSRFGITIDTAPNE